MATDHQRPAHPPAPRAARSARPATVPQHRQHREHEVERCLILTVTSGHCGDTRRPAFSRESQPIQSGTRSAQARACRRSGRRPASQRRWRNSCSPPRTPEARSACTLAELGANEHRVPCPRGGGIGSLIDDRHRGEPRRSARHVAAGGGQAVNQHTDRSELASSSAIEEASCCRRSSNRLRAASGVSPACRAGGRARRPPAWASRPTDRLG